MFSEKNSDIFSTVLNLPVFRKKRIFENISRKIFSRIRNLTLISRKYLPRKYLLEKISSLKVACLIFTAAIGDQIPVMTVKFHNVYHYTIVAPLAIV